MQNVDDRSGCSNTDVSFVILTWNSDRYITNCINSIISSLYDSSFEYEIFIIDNGSKDSTPDVLFELKNKFPEILNLIILDKNMGTTYSRNLGFKKARGKYICVMDSDVELFTGTVDKLIDNLETNSRIGLSVPKVLYPDGRIQKSTDCFPTIARKIFRYFFLKVIEAKQNGHLNITKPFEVDYAISAFWLLKRAVVKNVGLLDEKIFYSPEDVDYCLRIWKKGFSITYDPTISIVHHTQEISRGFKINKAFISHVMGLFYIFRKHRYWFRALNVRTK